MLKGNDVIALVASASVVAGVGADALTISPTVTVVAAGLDLPGGVRLQVRTTGSVLPSIGGHRTIGEEVMVVKVLLIVSTEVLALSIEEAGLASLRGLVSRPLVLSSRRILLLRTNPVLLAFAFEPLLFSAARFRILVVSSESSSNCSSNSYSSSFSLRIADASNSSIVISF